MSRIFLAGASGVIGRRLTPLLLDHGHSVWGTTRSQGNSELLRKLGARPVVVDVFDAEALATAVLDARPEVVIHQLTDLAVVHDPGGDRAPSPAMPASETKERAILSPPRARLALVVRRRASPGPMRLDRDPSAKTSRSTWMRRATGW